MSQANTPKPGYHCTKVNGFYRFFKDGIHVSQMVWFASNPHLTPSDLPMICATRKQRSVANAKLHLSKAQIESMKKMTPQERSVLVDTQNHVLSIDQDLERKLADCEEAKQSLTAQLRELNEAKDALVTSLREMTDQLRYERDQLAEEASLQGDSAARMAELQRELDAQSGLRVRLDALVVQEEASQTQIANLQSRLEESEGRCEEIIASVRSAADREILEARQLLEQQRADLQSAMQSNVSQIAEMTASLSQIASQRDRLQEELDALRAQKEQELADLNARLLRAIAERDDCNTNLNSLRNQYDSTIERLRALQAQIEEAQAEIAKKNALVDEFIVEKDAIGAAGERMMERMEREKMEIMRMAEELEVRAENCERRHQQLENDLQLESRRKRAEDMVVQAEEKVASVGLQPVTWEDFCAADEYRDKESGTCVNFSNIDIDDIEDCESDGKEWDYRIMSCETKEDMKYIREDIDRKSVV